MAYANRGTWVTSAPIAVRFGTALYLESSSSGDVSSSDPGASVDATFSARYRQFPVGLRLFPNPMTIRERFRP